MRDELTSRLLVADNSTMYTTTRIQNLILDAHLTATNMFPFPELQKAKMTGTLYGQYYYDYPTEFQVGSIFRVVVDDIVYDKVAFEDWLDYKKNNATVTDKYIFAEYGKQIFIFPTPTTTGTNNIDVYGQIQATQLSGDSDLTIFSRSDDQGNEAIVKIALSVAIARIDKALAMKEYEEAVQKLAAIFNKYANRKQREQRLDHPFFDVPNYFTGRGVSSTGNFSGR